MSSSTPSSPVKASADAEPKEEVKKPEEDVKKPESVGQGNRCELRSLQERYKKGSVETVATDEYKAIDFDENSDYALVSTQKFDEKGQYTGTTLKIYSEALLKVFRDVIVAHPEAPSGFDSSFEVDSPFAFLFHSWEDLEKHQEEVEDDTQRMHLALLLEFMDAEMGRQRKSVQQKVKNGSIEFKTLWTIFKPGKLVYSSDNGYPILLKLDKTVYEESEKTGKRFELHCMHTANDGTAIVRRAQVITLYEKKLFGGGTSAKITKLPGYPFTFVESQEAVVEKLKARGKRSSEMVGVLNKRYDGQAQYQRLPPRSWYSPDPSEYDTMWLGCKEVGRVVIDGKTYLEDYEYEAQSLSSSWPDEYQAWAEKQFGSIDGSNYALCVPHVFGFSLQRKDWCKFYVDLIEPIEWKEDAVDSLILEQNQKTLLEALVTAHDYPDNPRETAAQKGKGLVILLHGTPGSGKTLTAEVAAEVAQTGLLTITLGELYEYEYFDEWKLKMLLQYATMWKAVVLIDEADIFLEARTSGRDSNQERNSLVAVFLKYLEYFSGIVFLTSNRVEEFDAAMKSRVHLALQYAPPALELRQQIWTSRLSKIPADEITIDIAETVPKLIKYEMNGREIANSINTSRTLARHSNTKLTIAHIMTVIDVWQSFNVSLKKMQKKQAVEGRQQSLVPNTKPVGDGSSEEWETPE